MVPDRRSPEKEAVNGDVPAGTVTFVVVVVVVLNVPERRSPEKETVGVEEGAGPPERAVLLAAPVPPGPPAPKPLEPPLVAPEPLIMVTMLIDTGLDGVEEGEGEGPPEPTILLAPPVLPGPPDAPKPDSPPVAPAVDITVMSEKDGVEDGPPAPSVLLAPSVPAGPPEMM